MKNKEEVQFKVGTEEEAYWDGQLKQILKSIDDTKRQLEIQEYLVPFMEKKIATEKKSYEKK